MTTPQILLDYTRNLQILAKQMKQQETVVGVQSDETDPARAPGDRNKNQY